MNVIVHLGISLQQRIKPNQKVSDITLDFMNGKGKSRVSGKIMLRLQREGCLSTQQSLASSPLSTSPLSAGAAVSTGADGDLEEYGSDSEDEKHLIGGLKKISGVTKKLKRIQALAARESAVPPEGPRDFGRRLLPNDEVPEIVKVTIELLEEREALSTKGLFRETAAVGEVSALVEKWEARQPIDWSIIKNPHVIGGVLMQYLLRLPEPLISFSVYDQLLASESLLPNTLSNLLLRSFSD